MRPLAILYILHWPVPEEVGHDHIYAPLSCWAGTAYSQCKLLAGVAQSFMCLSGYFEQPDLLRSPPFWRVYQCIQIQYIESYIQHHWTIYTLPYSLANQSWSNQATYTASQVLLKLSKVSKRSHDFLYSCSVSMVTWAETSHEWWHVANLLWASTRGGTTGAVHQAISLWLSNNYPLAPRPRRMFLLKG